MTAANDLPGPPSAPLLPTAEASTRPSLQMDPQHCQVQLLQDLEPVRLWHWRVCDNFTRDSVAVYGLAPAVLQQLH